VKTKKFENTNMKRIQMTDPWVMGKTPLKLEEIVFLDDFYFV